MNRQITEHPEWRQWLTPKAARKAPIHRWYLFPHSFTGELVQAVIREWDLNTGDKLLDPFVGSGTTLLASKEVGVSSVGYDLSPLAVLASNTKAASLSLPRLEKVWQRLRRTFGRKKRTCMTRAYPALLHRALPDGRLEALDAIARAIRSVNCLSSERDFFRLALISIIPRFSNAVANGGWLRWLNRGADAKDVACLFTEQVELMLSDVGQTIPCDTGSWKAYVADARFMPAPDAVHSAVITSPPYPNRHDYTRVFGIELLFAFHGWEANRALRYQTFHSHPEARPKRPAATKYVPPAALRESVRDLRDKRIQRMLEGYFLDMYLCLCEVNRVCCKGAKVALVVGNAQYDGNSLLVDELTAEIGEQTGLVCNEIRAIRWRGNSAQQMGRYGRVPARESIVMFVKP